MGERSRALSVPDAATVGRILNASRGSMHFPPLVISATAGLRRGEVLALRWQDVDLERGTVAVRRSIITKARVPHVVEPKTPRALRQVEVPVSTVEVLKAHRREQAERRLALGAAWADLDLVCDPIAARTDH
jgi:integrase